MPGRPGAPWSPDVPLTPNASLDPEGPGSPGGPDVPGLPLSPLGPSIPDFPVKPNKKEGADVYSLDHREALGHQNHLPMEVLVQDSAQVNCPLWSAALENFDCWLQLLLELLG